MSWFTRKPSDDKVEVTAAIGKLDAARKTRRAAMKDLLLRLDDIPVEDGLTVVGKELASQPKGGR